MGDSKRAYVGSDLPDGGSVGAKYDIYDRLVLSWTGTWSLDSVAAEEFDSNSIGSIRCGLEPP